MEGPHLVDCPGGVKTVVHELGGTGPPLLVLPANGFPSRAYLPFVAHLRAHFRCLGVDLRGNGGNTPSGPGNNVFHFAADIVCIVKSLQLTGAYAFGHSVGGTSALRAQATHPGCLSAIYCYEPVIYDPSCLEPGVSQNPPGQLRELGLQLGAGDARILGPELLARIARKRRRLFPSRLEALSKYARNPPFNAFSEDSLQAYGAHGFRDVPGGVELRCNPADEADTYLTLNRSMAEFWPEAQRVSCPVAIMAGSNIAGSDVREFLAAVLEDSVSKLPTATFERLPCLYHMGPLEDPKRVAAAVLAHHRRSGVLTAKPAGLPQLLRQPEPQQTSTPSLISRL